jgi:hypothetical protein
MYGWSNSGTGNIITVSSSGIVNPFFSMSVYFAIISTDAGQMLGSCGGGCYYQKSTRYYWDLIIGGATFSSSNQLIISKITN